MPGRRDADMHPLPAAQEDEQVVVVEFPVSLQDRPGKPPGVAQGERQVVGPIDVPEEPVSPARAVIAPLRAFPHQVVSEVLPEGEMRQEGFAVEFRLRVAFGIAGEGGLPVNRPALLGPMSDDAEAEWGRGFMVGRSLPAPGSMPSGLVALRLSSRSRLHPGRLPLARARPRRSSSGRKARRRGLDADHLEASDSVEFLAVVASPECHLGDDDDAFGKGSLKLLQARHAELAQVALGERDCGFAEPDVMPEAPAGVLAVEHLERELVTRRAPLGVE